MTNVFVYYVESQWTQDGDAFYCDHVSYHYEEHEYDLPWTTYHNTATVYDKICSSCDRVLGLPDFAR